MGEWWTALGTAGQIFACIATPATVILIAQIIMTVIGLGAGHDADAHDAPDDGDGNAFDAGHDFDSGHDFDAGHDFDVSHDVGDLTEGGFDGDDAGHATDVHDHADGVTDGGLRLFTFRGLIAFFAVMGWTGALCCSGGLEAGVSIAIAVAAGVAAMLAVALLMKLIFSLQSDGTENVRDALGVSGTVYLRIPASRRGQGKVNAIIRGKLSEKNAVTDENSPIEYGEEITVIGISGEDTLIVRRKNRF